MFNRRQTRESLHGLTALILGLFLLAVSSNLGILKNAVDIVSGVLAVPEYPVVVLRGVLQDFFSWWQDKNVLKKRIESLEDENSKLRIAQAVLLNEQIRTELDERLNDARVTMRAPMSWWTEVRLNKGSSANVAVGSPVFQNGYLVGRITSVTMLSSWVELLTSSSLMVPVVIEETRELGVVMGGNDGSVILTYIPAGRDNLKGMRLSTALIGEQLPAGLPVGEIGEEMELKGDGYAIYRVKPGADFSRLYAVSLLKPGKGGF